jgi:hypothetical protein
MEILNLEWEDHNVDKLARHGTTRREVIELITLDAWVPFAHNAYPDQVRIIGPTSTGRMITVVLERAKKYGVWRPITGWDATPLELAYYREET